MALRRGSAALLPALGRAFAAEAQAPAVRAPIKMFDLSGRYAAALYQAAARAGALPAVKGDLDALEKASATNKTFAAFVKDPTLSREKKRQAVQAFAGPLKLDKTTANFLGLLAENGRMADLWGIAERFTEQLNAGTGTFVVNVTSAEPLDAASLSELEAVVKQRYVDANAKVTLKPEVDPRIMGGVVLRIGERLIDKSTRTKLRKLEQALTTG